MNQVLTAHQYSFEVIKKMGLLLNAVFFAMTMIIAFSFQEYMEMTKPFPKPELGNLIVHFFQVVNLDKFSFFSAKT